MTPARCDSCGAKVPRYPGTRPGTVCIENVRLYREDGASESGRPVSDYQLLGPAWFCGLECAGAWLSRLGGG